MAGGVCRAGARPWACRQPCCLPIDLEVGLLRITRR
jgi:hypothetical protein